MPSTKQKPVKNQKPSIFAAIAESFEKSKQEYLRQAEERMPNFQEHPSQQVRSMPVAFGGTRGTFRIEVQTSETGEQTFIQREQLSYLSFKKPKELTTAQMRLHISEYLSEKLAAHEKSQKFVSKSKGLQGLDISHVPVRAYRKLLNSVNDMGIFHAENCNFAQRDLETLVGNNPDLEVLNLQGNDIEDLSALSDMNLQHLIIENNKKVTDISPLIKHTKLSHLFLSGTSVKDLSLLPENLTTLSIEGLEDIDYRQLKSLARLETLFVANKEKKNPALQELVQARKELNRQDRNSPTLNVMFIN